MGTIINLAEPKLEGSMSLEQSIAERRSCRDFLPRPLSLEQIGQMAWAAQGQAPNRKFRTCPSAGATYPLELFVVIPDGLYGYLSSQHALEELMKKDMRKELCSAAFGQDFVREAPLTLVLAAEFERTTRHYGKRGVRYVYMEAGHAAQNIHLQAESLGLGSVAVGAFDDASVSNVLLLSDRLQPVYMVTVGYYRR